MSTPATDPNDLDDPAEVGTCALCGQEMIRTADDCWHPWYVPIACPWEPSPYDLAARNAWAAAGFRTLRPGREYFVPEGDRRA